MPVKYWDQPQRIAEKVMERTFDFLAGSLAIENRPIHFQIAEKVRKSLARHHGYLGYKLTTLGRASDEDIPSFIVVSQEAGILLIDVVEEHIVGTVQAEGADYWRPSVGEVFTARSLVVELYEEEVQSRLKNDLSLYDRKARRAKVPVQSVVVLCANSSDEVEDIMKGDESYVDGVTVEGLADWLDSLQPNYNCSSDTLAKIYSLLEGTFVYEHKRSPIESEDLVSIDDFIQKSLHTTFRQDEAQRLAAMQLPPGPQRIRGLAGTGKTIVLCLKAAITHKRLPDFKILYLFNTQSLYHHVQSLISKYYTLEAKKAPDFDNRLDVFHAWGGRQKPGLYSTLCQQLGVTPLTLGDVRGKGDPLTYIYRDLLNRMGDEIKPQYDLILIDEAQDFSTEIFQVAYRLAKGEGPQKRIIWAYDEFQSLRDTLIKGPAQLFGENQKGEANFPDSILEGFYEGDIPKDFVLPNCYRTPRPVLMTAHGVAMGLYAPRPVEMFYNSNDWSAIGYKVNQPDSLFISEGERVEIERPDANSKNLLESILADNARNSRELLQVQQRDNDASQLDFVATQIQGLIAGQGVSPDEIIIINLSRGGNKGAMLSIQRALNLVGIPSVIPGYVESADVFKPKGFVTITTPFRAKGNEANIVFVMNAQGVADDYTLRVRNAFFVAVTRSRGWCYITGYGDAMTKLVREIESIKRDLPYFRFTCPAADDLRESRSILSQSDKELDRWQEVIDLVDKNPEILDYLMSKRKQ